jgi:hypothetical protein
MSALGFGHSRQRRSRTSHCASAVTPKADVDQSFDRRRGSTIADIGPATAQTLGRKLPQAWHSPRQIRFSKLNRRPNALGWRIYYYSSPPCRPPAEQKCSLCSVLGHGRRDSVVGADASMPKSIRIRPTNQPYATAQGCRRPGQRAPAPVEGQDRVPSGPSRPARGPRPTHLC